MSLPLVELSYSTVANTKSSYYTIIPTIILPYPLLTSYFLFTPTTGPPVLPKILYTFPCLQYMFTKNYSLVHFFHIFTTDHNFSCTGCGERFFFPIPYTKQLFICIYQFISYKTYHMLTGHIIRCSVFRE